MKPNKKRMTGSEAAKLRWEHPEYRRKWRDGRPRSYVHATLEERFWSGVTKGAENDCWIWKKSCSGSGYGHIYWAGKYLSAHKVSWTIHRGDVPHQRFVCHRCDTPACVNPSHLWLGTHSENMKDAYGKGRLFSEDARKALSGAQTKRWSDPAARREQGEKLRGIKRSDDTRRRMKESWQNRDAARMLTHDGKTLTVTDWSKETGIPRLTIHMRIKRGWSVEKALATPTRPTKPM